MTPLTSTQCHGNSTPRTHPDGREHSNTRSIIKNIAMPTPHTPHSTHLRPALASRREPSLVPLETHHPAQGTRIVDGLTNTSPVTPYIQQVQGTHLVLGIHIRTRRDQLHSCLRLLVGDGNMKSSSSTLCIAFNR